MVKKMTNKSNAKKGTQMRPCTLDLEFDANSLQKKSGVTNNGFRPHGGYRGINKYPISQYTFNKDYKQQLRDDLDRLFGADSMESLTSPGYAIHASKDMTHSGDSPLFENRLLAPSRLEQKFSPEEYSETLVKSQIKAKRPSSGVQYYRPDSPHHYLPASRSSDSKSIDSAETKLGRPTRTTLLRARYRCNSAPINEYKMRKEIKKQYQQKQENLRATNTSVTFKDLFSMSVPSGESLHSFLIGARYNSAHCLDSRSMVNHGVYMPRGNPLGCFVLKEKNKESSESVPATPPDSPVSNSDNEDDGRPSTPVSKQAWSEEVPHDKRKTVKCTNIPIMDQIMNIDDGLNVKGTGVHDKNNKKSGRPVSARVVGSRPSSARAAAFSRIHSGRGPKPFVLIQGKSLPRSARSAIDQTLMENKPSSPPPSHVGKENIKSGSVKSSSARPRSSKHGKKFEKAVNVNVPTVEVQSTNMEKQEENECDKEVEEKNPVESETDIKGSSVENEAPSEIKIDPDEVKVETEDNGIIVNEKERGNDIEDQQLSEDNEKLILATKRTSRVRFADEVEELQTPRVEDSKQSNEPESHVRQGDNAVFFITEERNNGNVDNTTENKEGINVDNLTEQVPGDNNDAEGSEINEHTEDVKDKEDFEFVSSKTAEIDVGDMSDKDCNTEPFEQGLSDEVASEEKVEKNVENIGDENICESEKELEVDQEVSKQSKEGDIENLEESVS